ncbi:MAG: polysaccharide export protein [Azospirillaceae bacterium]|nr:polysaccharide export protein [Azospirillaceae bacterium]
MTRVPKRTVRGWWRVVQRFMRQIVQSQSSRFLQGGGAPTRFRPLFLLAVIGLSACADTVPPERQQPTAFPLLPKIPAEYRVGPGDDLSVILPFNPELNYEGPVGPDGRFTMPVVGSLLAQGRTVPEFEALLDKALVDNHIAANARPSLSIRHYAPVVYIDGEVKQPGAVPLQNKMTPLQAIAAAGGVLDTARPSAIVIIRQGPDGRPILRTVDLDAYVKTGDPDQAVALQPLDTVFVPKSTIAEVDKWVEQYITKALPFNRNLDYTISNSTAAPTNP